MSLTKAIGVLMLESLTATTPGYESDTAFARYARVYEEIERQFREEAGAFGLDWEPDASAFTQDDLARCAADLKKRGAAVANDCKSISVGWVSPSCIACRTGVGTETFLASTQCTRNCYFCFNPNQADYAYYLDHVHDMATELQQRYDAGVRHTHLAITGGEPLLHRAELMSFLRKARELCPAARVRLYTSGAGLDAEYARALAQAGIDEVRFSIKLDEPEATIAETLARMRLCVGMFEDVMAEMPVMPDQVKEMKLLLAEMDAMGCSGINLLELCFPFHNAKEFARRGYRLKAHPYRVLYNYWCAGGLPIAGSEQACLDLVEWVLDEKLRMGVHYCSLENKLTGQVFQQNHFIPAAHHHHEISRRDYFLKTAKVFGSDCNTARHVFDEAGVTGCSFDEGQGCLEFLPSLVPLLADAAPHMRVAICSAIAEMREGEPVLRELAVQVTTPKTFNYDLDI